MIRTQNFAIGLDYPVKPSRMSRIYLRGIHFANCWQMTPDTEPNNAGKWAINRDALALKMECPIFPPQKEREYALYLLELWLNTFTEEELTKFLGSKNS